MLNLKKISDDFGPLSAQVAGILVSSLVSVKFKRTLIAFQLYIFWKFNFFDIAVAPICIIPQAESGYMF